MIQNEGKEITIVYYIKQGVKITISYIRDMAGIVWQAVRSCFGSGQWKSDKPWIGDEKWKSNA